ncbi:hypothetical protein ACFQ2B_29495 [Streptomyces stramineus]
MLSLIREWIELAAACASGPVPDVPHPVLPPLGELLPAAHRGEEGAARSREQQEADEFLMSRLRPGRVRPGTAVPFEERRTRLVHRSLDAGQVAALVRVCRREGTTVHGALAAAMVTAVARDAGAVGPGHFAIGSPVDFRGDLVPPVSPQDIGSFVATLPSVVEYRPGQSLWPLARAVTTDLARRREREEHFRAVNLFSRLCPANKAESEPVLRFMDEAGPINLCLSNIGRFAFPAAIGPWQVEGAQFVAGLSVNGQFVGAVNTSHDRLFWNFTHVEEAMSHERADRLADDCVSTVLAATRTTAQ